MEINKVIGESTHMDCGFPLGYKVNHRIGASCANPVDFGDCQEGQMLPTACRGGSDWLQYRTA